MTTWLWDTLLATSALLLLVMIIRRPVAQHFGAGVAYCLWLLPAARLFMPSLTREIAVPVGSHNAVPDEIAFSNDIAVQPIDGIMPAGVDWMQIVFALWLGGAALLFIIQLIRYCAMRDDILADAAELHRIGDVRVIETEQVAGPVAFGLWCRYIAVPKEFARRFEPAERDLAIRHELAHHRAGDLYINVAAFLFLCLNWFNPLAWMAWEAFRFDQEAACDARVLAGADLETRQCYGRALARTATHSTHSFAMALNTPRTLIGRLRRLMMTETSKGRRFAGRLAIIATTAIALPLTATIVPVFAEDAAKAKESTVADTRLKTHKIISVYSDGSKPTMIDVKGDAETPFVKTIEKDGKTIVLRSSRELSEADVEKMVAEAEASRAEAEAAAGEAEAARGEAEAARGEAEAARAHAQHRIIRIKTSDGKNMAWTHDGNTEPGTIPDIDISAIDKKCKDGEVVTTNANGFDGNKKANIKIVMCGKGQAKLARIHAIQGLKEAKNEMKNDPDIPDTVRKSVLDSLQQQIDRMEKQLAEEKDAG